MSGEWRIDPEIKSRFHPDHPDDLQVIVHDGEHRRTGRSAEACWVTVTAVAGPLLAPMLNGEASPAGALSSTEPQIARTIYRGTLLNQPHQLTSVKAGMAVLFVAVPGLPHPLLVTEQYVKERAEWAFQPCNRCGADQGMDPPTVMARTRFPDAPEGATPIAFSAFCACGGTMMLALVDEQPASATTPPPKPWWKFW